MCTSSLFKPLYGNYNELTFFHIQNIYIYIWTWRADLLHLNKQHIIPFLNIGPIGQDKHINPCLFYGQWSIDKACLSPCEIITWMSEFYL